MCENCSDENCGGCEGTIITTNDDGTLLINNTLYSPVTDNLVAALTRASSRGLYLTDQIMDINGKKFISSERLDAINALIESFNRVSSGRN